MSRIFAALVGLVAAAGSLAATLAAQGADVWVSPAPKLQFESMRAADAPLQLDFPKKDWMVLPASQSVLLVMASKKGDAVVIVERSPLRLALQPADITDVFAQIEVDAIKARHPKAGDFLSKVLDARQRRLVAIQYTRPGALGNERARQYSLPVGRQLYRLTCVSSASRFQSYDQLFSHIAASLTVTE